MLGKASISSIPSFYEAACEHYSRYEFYKFLYLVNCHFYCVFRGIIDRIAELKGRVEVFRDKLSKNEVLTRYVLIDPFLKLLGWDTEDPRQVKPELMT
ncbi:hypothetical protein HRbin02_01829 [Candidatus Calditenuaceae archaeon HR02]|nr:hypothetical protein HRbin02_01829 [Candidatus Calditenuaceae archaeon HR02]